MKRIVVLLIAILWPIFNSLCQDQNAAVPTVSKLANRLNALTNRYGPSVYRFSGDIEFETVRNMFRTDIADSFALAKSAHSDEYHKYLKSDWGLRASGGFINNFSDGFEEAGFFYKSNYNVGLDWNLLKEGLLDHDLSARQAHYRNLIAEYQYKTEDAVSLNYLLDYLNQKFEKDIGVKNTFILQFLTEYENLAKDLYLGRYILWEDFLGISNQKKELALEIVNSESIGHQALRPYTSSDNLPVLTLVETALFSAFKSRNEADSILRINEDETRVKYSYWRDVTLRPFLRYNYYSYSDRQPTRDFLSGGVAFSVPLPLRRRTRESLQSASNNELKAELNQNFQSDLITLNDLVNLYHSSASSYLKQLNSCYIIEEQLRKEEIKKSLSDPEFSPLKTLNLIKEWLEKDVAMVENKRDLYVLIVRIANLANISPEAFTTPMEISFEKFTPQTSKEKSIYVWSSSLRKWPVATLISEIAADKYSDVLLSIDMNDTLRLHALELINGLKEKEIKVELMIANNSLLFEENKQRLTEALKFNLNVPGISGIHLDIEPHTQKAWKEQKESLMENYQQLIINTFELTHAENKTLSISIPLFYEMKFLKPVKEYLDQVFIMAYEHPDVEFITRKIKEEVSEFEDKIVLALRVKDFRDMEEMELFMEQLKKSTGINRFAVHDYSLVKGLETKTK